MSALAAAVVVAGLTGLVGFMLGLWKAKSVGTMFLTNELTPSLAHLGALEVLDHATKRGEDVQYLRAKAAIERYEEAYGLLEETI